MKTVRLALGLVTMAVLVLGYGASQYAYSQGAEQAVAYSERVDSPTIAAGALALLLAAVVLAFLSPGDTPGGDVERTGSQLESSKE